MLSPGDFLSHFSLFSSSFYSRQSRGFPSPRGTFPCPPVRSPSSTAKTSIRWLIQHERQAEAIEVLSCIEAKPGNDPYIITQRKEIEYSIIYERENAVSWREILLRKTTHDTKIFRRIVLGAGTQFMQQFGGINVISYYLPTVLIEAVGLSNAMARLISACNAVSYFVFTCGSVLLVERWGRRGIMMASTAGQCFSFLVITILLGLASQHPAEKEKLGSASIAFFFLFYISFAWGMLGVPWLYPTEINSLPMRNKGAAIATATNW